MKPTDNISVAKYITYFISVPKNKIQIVVISLIVDNLIKLGYGKSIILIYL